VHRRIGRRRPVHPTGPGGSPWQQQPVLAQREQHLPGGAEFGESAEHRRDGLHHGLVGADHDLVVGVVVEPDRQPLTQLPALRLVMQPRGQPGPDQVQLRLAHRALQAEYQPVVEIARVIHPVGVGDQRVSQRAQVQKLIPVGVIAGQPGHLDAENDPDMTQPDIGDQLLEPFPGGGLRTRPAQVGVDDPDLVGIPAQRHRAFTQLVLAGKALGVLPDLGQGGLADIDIGVTAEVDRADLGRHQHRGLSHRQPPPDRWAPRRPHSGRSDPPTGRAPEPGWPPAAATTARPGRIDRGPAA
jgi:hypothetical protein